MECQQCCHCSRGLPPLSPGARSGGTVVSRINCQPVRQVVVADSIETKRPCGTFPQSQTSIYYLLFNIPFCFLGKKKIGQVGPCLQCQSKDDARSNFLSQLTKSVLCQHVLSVCLTFSVSHTLSRSIIYKHYYAVISTIKC